MLDQQAGILERVEEAHQILVGVVLAGGGLEDLCQRLAGFLGGRRDGHHERRARARPGRADETWRAPWPLGCFDRTGRLITEHEPVGIRPPQAANARRAMVRIVAGPSTTACWRPSCGDRQLTADDVRLLERAATVAALAITKEQAVSAVESKYRAEFLRDALAGRAGHAPEAVAHAAAARVGHRPPDGRRRGRDRRGRRALDALTRGGRRPAATLRRARGARPWRCATRTRRSWGSARRSSRCCGVPADADTDAIMRMVAEVVRVVSGDGGGGRRTFSTGVSRPIDSAADLPQAYEEALSAVSVGRQLHGDSAVTHFDGLGVFRLLALIPDSADLRRFVDESLGELAADDSPENADLRRTLSILIDTNMNVAETARLLFFHYNTLRYRIAKLEKMLGPFTTDPQLRLNLALALKVHQMRGI